MFSKTFDVFEEYAPLCEKRKFMLLSNKEWTWFIICFYQG